MWALRCGRWLHLCVHTEVCSFTEFVIAWPVGSECTVTVARGLVDRAFLPFGTPRLLLTEPLNPFGTCPGHHLSTKIGRWRVLSGLVPGARRIFRCIIVLTPCFSVCTEDLDESQREAARGDFYPGPFRVACPASGCAFRSESRGRLANARRAVRGHALRVHSAAVIFDVPDGRLEYLSPDQLQARLATFQRGRVDAEQRRRRGAVPGATCRLGA